MSATGVPPNMSTDRSGENFVAPPVAPNFASLIMLRVSVDRTETWPEYRCESCRPCTGKPGNDGCRLLVVSGSARMWLRVVVKVMRCFWERLESTRTVG